MFAKFSLQNLLRRGILIPSAMLLLGLVIGLVYAWFINPLRLEVVEPTQLQAEVQEGPVGEIPPTTKEEVATSVPPVVFVCGVPLGLIVLVAFFVIVFRPRTRRASIPSTDTQEETTEILTTTVSERERSLEEAQPVLSTEPLTTFKVGYGLGNDKFQEVFRIKSPEGEQLGRCGVKIGDVYSEGPPRLVSTFEIALYDKDEIRTFTKVLMSRHAYNDEPTRTRLAARGEPELAQSEKVFNIETISLRLEVHITEMVYGEGAPPPQIFFERLKLELSVYQRMG